MTIRVDSGLACCAAHAAGEIAEALRLPIDKAIDPLTRGGYLRIVAQVRRALDAATAEGEAAAVAEALRVLDVDWPNLSAAARTATIEAARMAIGTAPARVMPRLDATLRVSGPRVMGETRAAATRRFDLSIGTSLSARDRAAERYVRLSTSNFVRDHYGVRRDELAARAREVVARGLEEGAGREAIAAGLRAELGNTIMRGDSYWQVVAGQFTNTARTFAEVGAFQDAGIQAYQFSAILDEVTTDECRFYDGQVFPLSTAVAARDRLSTLTNPDDVYRVAPWVRSGTAEDGSRIIYVDRGAGAGREVIATVDRSGVGARDDRGAYSGALTGAALAAATPPIPPLHANCRSTIIPASTG
jgi:SPP1 gp7 family putative phage head morphogenesis protein